MTTVTLQEVFCQSFSSYAQSRKLPLKHWKAARAIQRCRTPLQGGHLQRCPNGHEQRIQYHSCRHRSCPLCNALPREQWVQNQMRRLLNVEHYHLIFTLPHSLLPLWRHNQRWMTQTLFRVVSESVLTFSRDSRYLGGTPGLLLNIHTWGRNLSLHPHIHCLMTGGGLTPEGQWCSVKNGFLFPARALRTLYRGKFIAALNAGLRSGDLKRPANVSEGDVRSLLAELSATNWHVRIQPRYGYGTGVVKYLARYVKGGPLRGSRLRITDQGQVAFRYRDHRSLRNKSLVLPRDRMIGRVLEHVAESHQHTVRYYGLYGHQAQDRRNRCRELLRQGAEPERQRIEWAEYLGKQGQQSQIRCKVCGSRLVRGQSIVTNSLSKVARSGYVQQGVYTGIESRNGWPDG